MQPFLASLCLAIGQAFAWYVTIVHGLGITPRSWAWVGVGVMVSAVMAVLGKAIKQDSEA